MKKYIIISLCVILASFTKIFSQDLFIPKKLKTAYENQTRSFTGEPGQNYFQNASSYKINAEIFPSERRIQANEEILYYNNSEDSIGTLVFNIYQDLYKKGNSNFAKIEDCDLHSGVEISNIFINDEEYNEEISKIVREETYMFIRLNKKLAPNESAKISLDWEFTIPKETKIRMGTYFDKTFFVAYWYPKIAVFDDIYGWNVDVYDGQTEFYNDYSDFEIQITAPKDYIVLASGILQNPEDVLAKNILEKYNKAKLSDEIVNIITVEDRESKNITAEKEKLVWKFSSENITDFAFAVSDIYLWDAVSTEVNGQRVLVNSIYHQENETFNQVAEISKSVIEQAPQYFGGFDYPYPQMTAFQGHYGMEFPMMVNDGDDDFGGTVFVTAHEICHSYFPFFVGTNEIKYGWMDEGLITFLPKYIENELIEDNNALERMIGIYSRYAGVYDFDVPLMTPSNQLKGFCYSFNVYSKSAAALFTLKQILGEETFNLCLTEFIQRWKGKHPTGYDFFFTFNNVSGQNLNWFWQPWFFEFGYPDLAISDVVIDDKNVEVKINKIGNYPVPIKLSIIYTDDTEEIIETKDEEWNNNSESISVKFNTNKEIKEIQLGDKYIPDIDMTNNYYTEIKTK